MMCSPPLWGGYAHACIWISQIPWVLRTEQIQYKHTHTQTHIRQGWQGCRFLWKTWTSADSYHHLRAAVSLIMEIFLPYHQPFSYKLSNLCKSKVVFFYFCPNNEFIVFRSWGKSKRTGEDYWVCLSLMCFLFSHFNMKIGTTERAFVWWKNSQRQHHSPHESAQKNYASNQVLVNDNKQ